MIFNFHISPFLPKFAQTIAYSMMNNTLRHTSLIVVAAVLLLIVLGFLHIRSQESKSRHYAQLLEEADWMNQHDSLFTTDSVMLRVAQHYDHWWHPDSTRMKAYYLLGCAYRDLSTAPRALENYQRATELGDTTDTASLDRLMRIHSQMSELYMRQRLPEQMLEESRIAADLAWKIGDVRSALILETDYCYSLYDNQKYKEYIEKAMAIQQMFTKYGFEEEGKLLYINCFKSYMQLGNKEKAKACLDQYETCRFFEVAPEKVRGGLGALYIYKGQYFLETGEIDSAEYYFQEAMKYRGRNINELLATKGLYMTYAQKNMLDSTLKYISLYSDAKEKDFNSDISEATAQAKQLYDYTIEKETADKKTAEASRLRNIIAFVIITALLALLFILYRNEKKKRELSELRHKYQLMLYELHCNEEALQTLHAEQASTNEQKALLLTENFRLKAQVKGLEKAIQTKDVHAGTMDIQETDIVKHFYKYRTTAGTKCSIEESHWKELAEAIDKTNPNFRLTIDPLNELRETDYRVCMLDYIGFSPSDIAFFFNMSESFASKIRKRLHYKIFGDEGKPADFDRRIRSI